MQLSKKAEDFRFSRSQGRELVVERYTPKIEFAMKTLYDSLREKDRRCYAAVEAAKLGHGGIEYIASVFGCDPKTIRQGKVDLEQLPPIPPDWCRKKGVDANL
jgi:hypothetical protein